MAGSRSQRVIPAQAFPTLIHELQQADSSITREQGARPRGLAISKRIIEIVEIKGGAQLEGFLSGFRS
jgi:hypothetical protein